MVSRRELPQALVILGGSHDQLHLLRTAHDMELETVVLDGNPSAPGLTLATYGAPLDFSRVDRVVRYLRELRGRGVPLAGVTTMGSDVPHLLQQIGAAFGWEVPSAETARLATDKHVMKLRFHERGIPLPAFALVESTGDVAARWREWRCPRIVLKPTDRAGSRGVSVINEEDQISQAFAHARACSRAGEVIAEEYLEGPQISTESILFDGRAETPGFADRVYQGMEVFHPQILENGGWYPSQLAPDQRDRVVELVESAARALGIRRGVAKGDVVVHPERGPVMIEMAARLSGGDFCESLVPLGCGVNYVRAVVEIALGREPTWELLRPRWERVVANRYFFAPPGRLEAVVGLRRVRELPGVRKLEIWRRPGERISPIRSHGQRLGVVVIDGASREEVQGQVNRAYRRLRFVIDGRPVGGSPSGGREP